MYGWPQDLIGDHQGGATADLQGFLLFGVSGFDEQMAPNVTS